MCHGFSLPEVWFAAPAFAGWAGRALYTETALLKRDGNRWWNWNWWNTKHVLTKAEYEDFERALKSQEPGFDNSPQGECNRRQNCWRRWVKSWRAHAPMYDCICAHVVSSAHACGY